MFAKGRIPAALALVAGIGLTSLMSAQASPAPVAHATAAHAPNDQITPATLARFNAKLTALTKAHKFSGTVLVAQGNTVLLRKGYGMADWSHQIHNTSATEFVNDTLLTEFYTAAILQLEDAGKLHDQDHLCTYLPHCPATWSAITVRELLNGTSGIHDVDNHPTLGETLGNSYTLAQVADFAMQEPLEHKPGASVDSNGLCTRMITEYLVELRSGEPFAKYVQDHFLRPLGLTHTRVYLHTPAQAQHAVGYQSWQLPADAPEDYDLSLFGGAVYSTVDNVFRWEQAVNTGQVLSPASTAKFLTPSYLTCRTLARCSDEYTSAGTTEGRAFVTWHGHTVTYMNGFIPDIGSESEMLYFTDVKITVIILVNQNGSLDNAVQVDRLLFS